MSTKQRKKANNRNFYNYLISNKKLIFGLVFFGLFGSVLFESDFNELLPIKKIRAQGVFEHVTEQMILTAIQNDIDGGYLSINVHKLQHKVEQLAWVKVASIRRVWPDSIVVSIEEQKALAIWKDEALLNLDGVRFKPDSISSIKNLPVLSGPENLNIKIVAEFKLIESELQGIKLNVVKLHLDDRRATYIQLSNEIKISLGRQDKLKRLKLFITAFKLDLNKYSKNIKYIDMRYTNGFSIKWKGNTKAVAADKVLKGINHV